MSDMPANDVSKRLMEWAFTAVVLVAVALLLGSALFSSLISLAHPLTDIYFYLMEFLFYFKSSNEFIFATSIFCIFLTILIRMIGERFQKLPFGTGIVLYEVIWGFLCFLGILAQIYLIAFALLTEKAYFFLIIVASVTLYWLVSKRLLHFKSHNPSISDIPLPIIVLFVAIHLFLGMVSGHLATPFVHFVSTEIVHLSKFNTLLYKIFIIVCLFFPFLVWLPRLLVKQVKPNYLVFLPLILSMLFLLTPTKVAIFGVGILSAMAIAFAMSMDGYKPINWLHPSPRILFTKIMFIALISLNAVSVHYYSQMWSCSNQDDNIPALINVSYERGVFDLVSTCDVKRLLASQREQRRLIEVDIKTGKTRSLLNTSDIMEGTNHLFSWVEPETLLALREMNLFLLLVAVSDDENLNRIAIITADGRVGGFVEGLPQAGISDMVADEQGHIFISTEFRGTIFVLDDASLRVIGAMQWPNAETNRILVVPETGRIYSLGLWKDPMLRVFDIQQGKELASVAIGTRSWDMAYDAEKEILFVPRLLSGKVFVVDAKKLKILEEWPVSFGVRPVEFDPEYRLLYVGNMYSGEVTVFDVDRKQVVFKVHLGGYIKSLYINPITHKAYTGCVCGIFEIDPALF